MKLRVNGLVRLAFALSLAPAVPLAGQPTEKVTSATATDKRLSAYALKVPTPFACPAPQLAFQRPDGRWACIAADSNPCPPGQVLDTTTKPGFAQCRALPDRRVLTCPAGQVAVQQATGRWVCVAKP